MSVTRDSEKREEHNKAHTTRGDNTIFNKKKLFCFWQDNKYKEITTNMKQHKGSSGTWRQRQIQQETPDSESF